MRKLLGLILVLCGIGIFIYPTVSSMFNEYEATRTVSEYKEAVKTTDSDAAITDAIRYNETIEKGTSLVSEKNNETDSEYESLLNITEDGVMGYIEIPVISQKLPIYHYTSDEQLKKGVGHLYGSSLPVGGESTNCVLSGHRGLPSSLIFTRLDEVKMGDLILLHSLTEDLTYVVKYIKVVLPDEVDDIQIEEGKDLLTLVTCTPYAINTHRLIIVAERTENVEIEEVTDTEVITKAVKPTRLIIALLVIVLLIALNMGFKRKAKNEEKKDSITHNDNSRNDNIYNSDDIKKDN